MHVIIHHGVAENLREIDPRKTLEYGYEPVFFHRAEGKTVKGRAGNHMIHTFLVFAEHPGCSWHAIVTSCIIKKRIREYVCHTYQKEQPVVK
jgi:hypothetical protein